MRHEAWRQANLIAGLLTAPGSPAGAVPHANGTAITSMNSSPTGPIALLQGQQNNGNSNLPRASINWLLFNEQFECIGSGTSAVNQVAGNVKDHSMLNIPVDRNGYLYVYCSNESVSDVLFDNLQVLHTKGPLLEETHYYPFGLTMQGISYKAANTQPNKLKYNGKEEQRQEFSDGSGLDWLDYGARMYDAQVGKWGVVDPLAIKSESKSVYTYCSNNPTNFLDPDGKTDYYFNNVGNLIGIVRNNSNSDGVYKVNAQNMVVRLGTFNHSYYG